jgi:hypothetical protein
MRRDRWWVTPAWEAVGLTAFVIYTVVVGILGKNYFYAKGGAYLLSPMYSPDLKRLFGWNITFTYAFFVLWAPATLRATCYIYRKSYYRAFFLAPPSCAVAGLQRQKYSGETKFPLIFQNLHRFFWTCGTLVLGFLWYDTVRGFLYTPHPGDWHFGIGVGSIVLLINVILLSLFSFGCNSFRHIIGGRIDCFDCSTTARVRHGVWAKIVTPLNHHHELWAWISMFVVGLTDLYVRLAAAGVFTDPHHIF